MKISLPLLFLMLCFSQGVTQNLQVPTLSPFTSIEQEVGLTKIKLEYARPSSKGRTVFGELVPYDVVWRTGANASTKLTFTEDVKVGGHDLKAGTYALYTIPGKENWTIIIHTNTNHRSIAGDTYKQEEDAFRFEVPSISNPLIIETFTIQFSDITSNSLQLTIAWENTMVQIPIEVEVDAKVESQMMDFMKSTQPIPDRTYFLAAEYYLHNGRDLNQALGWIDDALKASEKNFRYGLLKAKILAAQGNKAEAMSAIKAAYMWAVTANNANYKEQTSLYMKELEKLK